MGVTTVVAVVFVMVNLLVDLSYAVLDPRVMHDDAASIWRDPHRSGSRRSRGCRDPVGRRAAPALAAPLRVARVRGAVIVAWVLAPCWHPGSRPMDPTRWTSRLGCRPVLAALAGHRRARPRRADARDLGARVSLSVGFSVVLIGGVFGTLLGAAAAYMRGWAEEVLMRLTDLVFCFPPIILAMAIAAALGIGTVNTVIAMLVVWWPKFARLARSLVLAALARICRGARVRSASARPHPAAPDHPRTPSAR